MPLKHITDELLLATIQNLPDEFDSHELLRTLATDHPHAYVRELYEKLHTSDPILQAHADIASQLNRELFHGVVAKAGRWPSPNVRGKDTENQVWHRR